METAPPSEHDIPSDATYDPEQSEMDTDDHLHVVDFSFRSQGITVILKTNGCRPVWYRITLNEETICIHFKGNQ